MLIIQDHGKSGPFTATTEEAMKHSISHRLRRKVLYSEKNTRLAAINTLANHSLKSLASKDRESLLLNWWALDENDTILSSLSTELQQLVLDHEEPPKDIEHSLADELILFGLVSDYKGVTNEFLADQLIELGYGAYEIEGDVEFLSACPCCEHRTLSTISNYEICNLCKWEDDGTTAPETYSHPNHMTLSDAKEEFCKRSGTLPLKKWIRAS